MLHSTYYTPSRWADVACPPALVNKKNKNQPAQWDEGVVFSISQLQMICYLSLLEARYTKQLRKSYLQSLIPTPPNMPKSDFRTITCLKSNKSGEFPLPLPNICPHPNLKRPNNHIRTPPSPHALILKFHNWFPHNLSSWHKDITTSSKELV